MKLFSNYKVGLMFLFCLWGYLIIAIIQVKQMFLIISSLYFAS